MITLISLFMSLEIMSALFCFKTNSMNAYFGHLVGLVTGIVLVSFISWIKNKLF